MPTTDTLWPTSDNAYSANWTKVGSATLYGAVDEDPHDGNTSTIYPSDNQPATVIFGPLPSIPTGATDISLKITITVAGGSRNGANSLAFGCKVDSTTYWTDDEATIAADYTAYTHTYTGNPSGDAWTVATANTTRFGFKLTPFDGMGGPWPPFCTQCKAEWTYTAAAAPTFTPCYLGIV